MSSLSRFLFGPAVIITTELTPEECLERCGERATQGLSRTNLSGFNFKPAKGEVGASNLRWRKNSILHSLFHHYQGELRATFAGLEGGRGTRIDCRFRGGGIVYWLCGIVPAFGLLAMMLFGFARDLFSGRSDLLGALDSLFRSKGLFLIIAAGFLGAVLVAGRRDRAFLLNLLTRTVDGEMHEGAAGAKMPSPAVA